MTTPDEMRAMADRLDIGADAHDLNDWINMTEAAAAMLRSIAEEREWRDMDSAPKDGSQFIAKDGNLIGVISWYAER